MLTITERIHALYDNVGNRNPGAPFTRYKSWEYCHNRFMDFHRRQMEEQYQLTDEDYDFLALNLAFYLASWGMYRGSSFLLQRDYKAHLAAVRIIMNPEKRNDIWEFDPSSSTNLNNDAEYIFQLGNEIINTYRPILEKILIVDNETEDVKDFSKISAVLTTKILMGTFACVPAYDRFFINGIKRENAVFNLKNNLTSNYSIKSLKLIFEYASLHKGEFDGVKIGNNYPIMKNVDMYFWQLGYEIGFLDRRSQFQKLLTKHNNGTDLDNCPKSANSRDKIILLFKTFIHEDEYENINIKNLNEWKRIIENRNS